MGLLDFLFGHSQQPTPQGGLLSAPTGADQKAYQDYAIDQQSQGKAPVPFQAWYKQQQMLRQQPKQ